MAASIKSGTRVREVRAGTNTELHLQLNLGTYATGGVAFDPRKFSECKTLGIAIVPAQNSRTYEYDYANKLILARSAAGVEVADQTDLSAEVVRAVFVLHTSSS